MVGCALTFSLTSVTGSQAAERNDLLRGAVWILRLPQNKKPFERTYVPGLNVTRLKCLAATAIPWLTVKRMVTRVGRKCWNGTAASTVRVTPLYIGRKSGVAAVRAWSSRWSTKMKCCD